MIRATLLILVLATPGLCADAAKAKLRFARFKAGDQVHYGVVEGNRLRQIEGSIFGKWERTEKTHAIADVQLMVPTRARHVFAMAGNYKSHLADAVIPVKFRTPQPFFKSPSSLQRHEGKIILPVNATEEVHFEAEMVVVIGKRAKDVSESDALDHVFGVTCGNDVSERFWQNDEEHKDVQWWRAKASDTFGPCGPFIATGLNPDDLLLTLRLNGEVKQKERTKNMIHNVAKQISFISKHVTLLPGDLIFTGTSGTTSKLSPGDVVEVELEGVGVLRNTVRRERR